MTMAWIGIGAAVLGAGASVYGANKQAKGAEKAGAINMDMFNVLNRQQQPFMQSGYGAMGRLNTLLGINPNPNYRPPTASSNPGFMPTPSGGVQPIMQRGPDVGLPRQPPRAYAQSGGQGTRLNQLLMLRAANGDRQAQAMLRGLG